MICSKGTSRLMTPLFPIYGRFPYYPYSIGISYWEYGFLIAHISIHTFWLTPFHTPKGGTIIWGSPKRQDRNKFSKLCDSLRVDQPEWSQFATLEEARRFCKTAGGGSMMRKRFTTICMDPYGPIKTVVYFR